MYPRLESLYRIEWELRHRGFMPQPPQKSGRTFLVEWKREGATVKIDIQHDGAWDLLIPDEKTGAYVGMPGADMLDTMRRLAAYDAATRGE